MNEKINVDPLRFVNEKVYTQADMDHARQEARATAYTDCITELCIDCAEGDAPTFDAKARWCYHGAGTEREVGCAASKIRIRVAAIAPLLTQLITMKGKKE